MRIETGTDYYYDVLAIYERLREELALRFGSVYQATKFIGKSKAYLTSPEHITSVQNLNKICKQCDIDFDYLILRKHNSGKYTEKKITFDTLIKTYKENCYKRRTPDSIKSIICQIIRQGKNNIKIATLLYMADFYKKNPLELLT